MTITEWDFDVELKVARREEREGVARKMIANNESVERIMLFAGLAVDDVLRLQSEGL